MTKKHIVIGILAHVDAGKTSLSESLLYTSGAIRSLGRVDKQTAFLDTDQIERNRGITVFSKEARFSAGDTQFTLLDTPGHADFSMEAERTLSVLDYAILTVSGAEGVQAHTLTLWSLLKAQGVPTFVFVNKMDRAGASRERVLSELSENFGDGFTDMRSAEAAGAIASEEAARPADPKKAGVRADGDAEKIREELAMCSDELMEEYLADGRMQPESVRNAIKDRKLYPVYFGSALKMEGIEEFLSGLAKYTKEPSYPADFGARVYKITRDKQGARLTHMKITGGCLKSKMPVPGCGEAGAEEKAEQIRLYSGTGFEAASEAGSGMVCAVTGLEKSYAGQGLGKEAGTGRAPVIEPAMSYKMILPAETDAATFLRQLRQLEEEEPSLRVFWNEEAAEINVHVMGELALEILQNVIERRFGVTVAFGQGSPVYKETVAAPSVGIGHFEPLRHYAEVHLLLEPGEPGSGLVFDSMVSEDRLDRNWQRLILTHLAERPHPGVLTGSDITDMKITIIAGRAHVKHTEGGDFRQATYRALRQGLRRARCVLLEPVVSFRLTLPQENIGRALSDMQRFGAEAALAETAGAGAAGSFASGGGQLALITGIGPAAILNGYQKEVAAYTRGHGRFLAVPAGYRPCKNQEEIIEKIGYEPERDIENPTGSVFCEHGAAVYVDWQQVDKMAHVDSGFLPDGRRKGAATAGASGSAADTRGAGSYGGGLSAAAEKELDAIFLRTYGKSKRDEALRRERISKGSSRENAKAGQFTLPPLKKTQEKKGEPLLIVDGYNVIFAWEELAALAKENIDSAREALLEILENYHGYKKTRIVAVFDGYKVAGSPGSKQEYEGVTAVYTKEAETADRFIERTVYEKGRSCDVTVVTSDRLVQMTALGDGALRLSAREFYDEVSAVSAEIREKLKRQAVVKNRPFQEKLENQKK